MAIIVLAATATLGDAASQVAYEDGRPQTNLRLEAKDQGVGLRHGAGPNQCDYLGIRDMWVCQQADTYYYQFLLVF